MTRFTLVPLVAGTLLRHTVSLPVTQSPPTMRSVALYEMFLGLLTIVGGIIGFTSADSWISLVSGAVAGAILFGAGLSMQKGSRTAMFVALTFSLLLAIYGAQRLLADDALVPGGLVVAVSLLSVLFVILLLVQPKERKRIF